MASLSLAAAKAKVEGRRCRVVVVVVVIVVVQGGGWGRSPRRRGGGLIVREEDDLLYVEELDDCAVASDGALVGEETRRPS